MLTYMYVNTGAGGTHKCSVIITCMYVYRESRVQSSVYTYLKCSGHQTMKMAMLSAHPPALSDSQ